MHADTQAVSKLIEASLELLALRVVRAAAAAAARGGRRLGLGLLRRDWLAGGAAGELARSRLGAAARGVPGRAAAPGVGGSAEVRDLVGQRAGGHIPFQ